MNSALNNYSATQHRADLVREARQYRPRPTTVQKLDAVEQPRPRQWRRLWLLQASRSAA